MSADDFQTKYASVMEGMLRSAVAETTKLFETMVDELKAELSKIKKENEDLKTRCSQFESERSELAVNTAQSELPPVQSKDSEKRDTAIQCDLVPFRTVLVEQCQPLRESSQNQKQQFGFEEMDYVLKEHNSDHNGGVKLEDDSSLQSVLKQEEVESAIFCEQILNVKADPPWASACGIEKEGPFINKVCSPKEILMPQRQEETQVALEQEHSVVVSLAEIKNNKEEEAKISPKIVEFGTQGELMTCETHQLVVTRVQSEIEPLEKGQAMSVNEQTDVSLQGHADVQSAHKELAQATPLNEGEACSKLKNGVAEVESSCQPDLSVRRRRGRPPKTAKHMQHQVKEIPQSQSSDFPTDQGVKKSSTVRVTKSGVTTVHLANVTLSESLQQCSIQPKESLSIITPSIQERASTTLEDVENSKMGSLTVTVASMSRSSSETAKTSKSQQLSIEMEEGEIQASSVSSAVETLSTLTGKSTQEPREDHTPVTLQDAILLVEAMNQSMVDNPLSSQKRTPPPQTQSVPCVVPLQTMDKVSAEQHTQLPETNEAAGNPKTEKHSAPAQATDATRTDEVQAHIKVEIPKQQHIVSLSNAVSSSQVKPSKTVPASDQTGVKSLQQHCPYPLVTLVAPSRQDNKITHKIIVIPRSVASLMPHNISTQSSTHLPAVTSTAVAAQNDHVLPASTAAGLLPGTPSPSPSPSSLPQKTIYVISRKLLPVVTQSTPNSADSLLDTSLSSKKTVMIPKQVSAVASQEHHSQTSVLTAQQESTKSTPPVVVLPQELSNSMDAQTTLDLMAAVISQKRDNATKNLESLKQTTPVSGTSDVHTETCSSLNVLVELSPTFKSPVVRLARLPFPISTTESVLISRLPTNISSDSHSVLKEGTRHQKSSSFGMSTQPPETLVLSTNIYPNLKETSVAVSVNTSQRSEEPNHIEEKASLSLENGMTWEELSNSSYMQPSIPSKVSQPVFEKLAITINTTKPSAISGAADELTCNLHEEKITTGAQHCVLASDQLIKKQSSALLHQTFITSKDTSGQHLQMSKSQFLAQLAVSPVDPDKTSSNDFVDARASCAETSEKKNSQKNGMMAKLRSHIKSHLQAKRAETDSVSGTEIEIHTVRPKKSRLENDYPNDKNTTWEPVPLSSINPAADNVAFLKSTTTDLTPIYPKTSGQFKDGVKPKRIASESSFVSSMSCNASESTSVNHRKSFSGRDDVSLKNKKSTSMGPVRASSTSNSASLKIKKACSNPNNAEPTSAKTIAKLKNLNQSKLQNGTKANQFAENSAEAKKKCTAKAVWTPPEMVVNETSPAVEKVYPPSVPLKPIPVRAPPIVSPLQPLSVIGWRLLKNQCGECGRVFNSSAALESHVSLHKGRRPLSCTLCGKRFPDSKCLKRHGRAHRNGRIHVCQKCGKGFVYRFCLTKHLQMVHSKIRPFVCQICNKGFLIKRDVEAHLRLHTGEKPFHCNLCEKKFARRVDLNVHLRWHNGEKRHWCPYCGKGFLDFNNLKRHKYVHTGEKPHSCPHCSKKFKQSGHLKKHIKNVHKIQ